MLLRRVHGFNNYYITKIEQSMLSASKISIQTPPTLHQQPQLQPQLIVEINIGKKGAKQYITLLQTTNTQHIESQIRSFMKQHRLKEPAFSFIKDIIVRKIAQSKGAATHQNSHKCQYNCKCSNNHRSRDEKQGHQFISFDEFNDSFRRSICKLSSITPKRENNCRNGTNGVQKGENISTNVRNEDVSSFVFNSSFTLPSSACDKDRYITDEIFEDVLNVSTNKSGDYFSNMSEFKSKGRYQGVKADRGMLRPSFGQLNKNEKARNIQTSNFYEEENSSGNHDQSVGKSTQLDTKVRTSIPLTITINTPQRKKRSTIIPSDRNALTPISVNNLQASQCKKGASLSTRQRKQLLMKSQRRKFPEGEKEQQSPSFVILNSENLQEMVVEQKRLLKQDFSSLSQQGKQDTTLANQIPDSFEEVLRSLFKKLTAKNPPQFNELHSQYVSYQFLSREQLGFMGVLFEKIDYKELNNLNYSTFRKNSLKFCLKELQELSSSYFQSNMPVKNRQSLEKFI